MPDLSRSTDDELRGRVEMLLRRLDHQLRAIAPALVSIGQDRDEAEVIITEMKKRGLEVGSGKDAAL